MCDCVQSAANQYIGTRFRKLGQGQCSWNNKPILLASEILTGYKVCSVMKSLSNRKFRRIFRHDKLIMDQRLVTNLGVFGSNAFDLSSELRLKEGGDDHFELGLQNGEEKLEDLELGLISEKEAFGYASDSLNSEKNENGKFGRLNSENGLQAGGEGRVSKAEDFMSIEGDGENEDLEFGDDQVEETLQSKPKPKYKPKRKLESRSRKQLMRRSSILAKQVIGIMSACSLGFVSQLWVDTATVSSYDPLFKSV